MNGIVSNSGTQLTPAFPKSLSIEVATNGFVVRLGYQETRIAVNAEEVGKIVVDYLKA